MKKTKRLGMSLGLLSLVLVIAGCGVENGNVGIEITPTGKVASEKVLEPGFRFTPINDIVQYPVKIVEVPYNKSENGYGAITVATKDGKRIDIEMKVTYSVEKDRVLDIYRKFGNVTQKDMEQGWLRNQTQNAMRDEYIKHHILDIVQGNEKSSTLEADVIENIRERFSKEGYVLEDVTLGVPEVDKATQTTIDSIIEATQANEKAKKDAETKLTEAKSKAEVARTEAETTLYRAQKEAEANAILAKSVTDELIRYKEAEAREKHGWVTVKGGEPLVQTGK